MQRLQRLQGLNGLSRWSILLVALVAVLSLALVGCNGEDEGAAGDTIEQAEPGTADGTEGTEGTEGTGDVDQGQGEALLDQPISFGFGQGQDVSGQVMLNPVSDETTQVDVQLQVPQGENVENLTAALYTAPCADLQGDTTLDPLAELSGSGGQLGGEVQTSLINLLDRDTAIAVRDEQGQVVSCTELPSTADLSLGGQGDTQSETETGSG